ncbi:hypothetical protein ACFE04_022863 [Oxalis oulophora]
MDEMIKLRASKPVFEQFISNNKGNKIHGRSYPSAGHRLQPLVPLNMPFLFNAKNKKSSASITSGSDSVVHNRALKVKEAQRQLKISAVICEKFSSHVTLFVLKRLKLTFYSEKIDGKSYGCDEMAVMAFASDDCQLPRA